MSEKLKSALVDKEKAESYILNLEKLKEEKAIDDVQFNILKAEYTKLRNDALTRVSAEKAEIKKVLDVKLKELATIKNTHKYLEIRHKVGQISAAEFAKQESTPKKKIMALEKVIGDLQKSFNAANSSEITVESGGTKVFGLFGKGKKQEPDQMLISPFPEPVPPPPVNPEPPVMEQPVQAAPPVMDTPPAPPPVYHPATVSVQKIERRIDEESELEAEGPDGKDKSRKSLPRGLTISNLDILPERVIAGNEVGIIVSLKNISEQPVGHRLDLVINGEIRDAADIMLEAGKKDEITFLITAEDPGEYNIDLGGQHGRFIVVGA